MLISIDAKQLEWRIGSELAEDQTALEEIINCVDMHAVNQKVFTLPSRLIAKKFLFRLIFSSGYAPTYANDPDFMEVSTNIKYWQNAIDAFHNKYKGWVNYWTSSVREVIKNGGWYSGPSGRIWTFERFRDNRGEYKWPENSIKNYRVQGTSADMMSLARKLLHKKIVEYDRPKEILLVNTVHDSIVIDTPTRFVPDVCEMGFSVFDSLNEEWYNHFGTIISVPMECEIVVGGNLSDVTEVKRNLP